MSEAEWMACTDPQKMLDFLRTKSGKMDRKFRLFACGCGRFAANHVMDDICVSAVDTAERHADRQATPGELDEASMRVTVLLSESARRVLGGERQALWEMEIIRRATASFPYVPRSVPSPTWEAAQSIAMLFARWPAWSSLRTDKRSDTAAVLHCIFGNPFRPVTILPCILAWNDGLVTRLAQAAYDERHLPEGRLDKTRLTVLADALEEAGCTDADILGHLRGPGPHVRGCWAVDMVLGKS